MHDDIDGDSSGGRGRRRMPWFFVCACKYSSIRTAARQCHGSQKFPTDSIVIIIMTVDVLSLLLLLRNILFPPQQFFFRVEWTSFLRFFPQFFSHVFMRKFVCRFLCLHRIIKFHETSFALFNCTACMHAFQMVIPLKYTLPYMPPMYRMQNKLQTVLKIMCELHNVIAVSVHPHMQAISHTYMILVGM